MADTPKRHKDAHTAENPEKRTIVEANKELREDERSDGKEAERKRSGESAR
ncbi:hypothetical protein [Oricola thermophila]|uniref:Uncharacterized protein n=1 Tax=Oricola thermophila TaxID=2742145 RepID=A0A6N1VBL6_9HYPH|nr:hypothetical protein [Oricola thermophila]QKV18401.1 hypothetical protein HTY61_08010 [Oricola thermophila]